MFFLSRGEFSSENSSNWNGSEAVWVGNLFLFFAFHQCLWVNARVIRFVCGWKLETFVVRISDRFERFDLPAWLIYFAFILRKKKKERKSFQHVHVWWSSLFVSQFKSQLAQWISHWKCYAKVIKMTKSSETNGVGGRLLSVSIYWQKKRERELEMCNNN